MPPLGRCGARLLPLSMKPGMKNPLHPRVTLARYSGSGARAHALSGGCRRCEQTESKDYRGDLMHGNEAHRFSTLAVFAHRDGTDQPKRACRLEADDFGCVLSLFCHFLVDLGSHKSSQLRPTSLPVGKTRLLSRVVLGGSKSPFSGRCSVCRTRLPLP